MNQTILILGAGGQIGNELTLKLRSIYGSKNVIASDIKSCERLFNSEGPFEIIDATSRDAVLKVIQKYQVTQVYLLAAMLSATGEKFPQKAWYLNMTSLLVVLDLAKEKYIKQVFWPSSIAAFGPTTPKHNTPQKTMMEPSTVYGMSKRSGEFWCQYYHEKYGVDVRSLRYPGVISWKTKPGGGTTDYAVDIFFHAIKTQSYECFLKPSTRLPMMYMDDAVDATIKIMQANVKDIQIRTSYNISAMDFTPEELAKEIRKHIPKFTMSYHPDFRQAIADSWPQTINDSHARRDWNWNQRYDLSLMTKDIIKNLQAQKNLEFNAL